MTYDPFFRGRPDSRGHVSGQPESVHPHLNSGSERQGMFLGDEASSRASRSIPMKLIVMVTVVVAVLVSVIVIFT
jgi:hypothetical protein